MIGTQARFEELKQQHGQTRACELFRDEVKQSWADWFLKIFGMTSEAYHKQWEEQ